ncbi:hypothetical protein [Amycolatopsis magusensis]|uniref:hypothetical protein n=1 Tax=Amycolatopsis magusensis TaxID=882444 RepID=UPI00378AB0D9
MPDPAETELTHTALFSVAKDHEADAIREVAVRAGLLQRCRCGWYNPPGAEQCQDCTRTLPETAPTSVPALGLVAVRDYLGNEHSNGDLQFIAVCRGGLCGDLAAEVALDLAAAAGAKRQSSSVIADEIVAGVEARALASGAPRVTTTV